MENRRLPASVQQAIARRVLPAGGLKPPLAPLGSDPLRPGPPVSYLDRDEITALLAAPDKGTRLGRRDHALLRS